MLVKTTSILLSSYLRIRPALLGTFLEKQLRVKGDFTFRNTSNNTLQHRVQLPYSNKPGVIAYVGTTTNDLSYDDRATQYIAANLYSEYENTFGDRSFPEIYVWL